MSRLLLLVSDLLQNTVIRLTDSFANGCGAVQEYVETKNEHNIKKNRVHPKKIVFDASEKKHDSYLN